MIDTLGESYNDDDEQFNTSFKTLRNDILELPSLDPETRAIFINSRHLATLTPLQFCEKDLLVSLGWPYSHS